MRGGLERWKRGVESHGVRQALAYALQASCDSHFPSVGVDALAIYGDSAAGVVRFSVTDAAISTDVLDDRQLRLWVDGCDPLTGERRGRELMSPDADLILDGTINAPKSFSIAALLHPELADEYEALQDRLRGQILRTWHSELNARRGAGGLVREELARIEVVELSHRRSRALDPHIHRHLWLNVKVLGRDGKWSNVDSRVAMRLHTLINAEGEVAARTDPEWIAALARFGLTVNADGEIAELTGLVRPLSRRSNQIEANRIMFLARWRAENPGREPSADVLHQIDRRSWATARPGKPLALDEADWEALVRSEIDELDPNATRSRAGICTPAFEMDAVDVAALAERAIVDADSRSTSSSGRFSILDVRAGAARAVATTGVVATRDELQPLIESVTEAAMLHTIDLLDNATDRPQHVKALMATNTIVLKTRLSEALDRIAQRGTPATVGGSDSDRPFDEHQLDAIAAIAGTDRLVSVTGPAGAGKTTVLRAARDLLSGQGRRMIVVAPTKKAAMVAGREVGSSASSLHALLADHGWRWTNAPSGATVWRRIEVGDRDDRGQVYAGPQRHAIRRGDRIVVDEAGMVDLETANALLDVVSRTGAHLATIGDDLQAAPVGHAGAMAMATHRATAVVELNAVHRFHDSSYGDLSLRMRRPSSIEDARVVADELAARGCVRRIDHGSEAVTTMVDRYFEETRAGRTVAVVTGTNSEADVVNEAVQRRRLDDGEIAPRLTAIGRDEQHLFVGDRVQTRANDSAAGVENRALWRIGSIDEGGLRLVSLTETGVSRFITDDYAARHVQLAYASTVHGIQGETVDVAIVGPGMDAAGLYVGMTRGRWHNEVVIVAPTMPAASAEIAEDFMRGGREVTVDDSVNAARRELRRAATDPPRSNLDTRPRPHHIPSPVANVPDGIGWI